MNTLYVQNALQDTYDRKQRGTNIIIRHHAYVERDLGLKHQR